MKDTELHIDENFHTIPKKSRGRNREKSVRLGTSYSARVYKKLMKAANERDIKEQDIIRMAVSHQLKLWGY